MDIKKRNPGCRLLQLALHDAINSKLSVVSAFKRDFDQKKRDKWKKNQSERGGTQTSLVTDEMSKILKGIEKEKNDRQLYCNDISSFNRAQILKDKGRHKRIPKHVLNPRKSHGVPLYFNDAIPGQYVENVPEIEPYNSFNWPSQPFGSTNSSCSSLSNDSIYKTEFPTSKEEPAETSIDRGARFISKGYYNFEDDAYRNFPLTRSTPDNPKTVDDKPFYACLSGEVGPLPVNKECLTTCIFPNFDRPAFLERKISNCMCARCSKPKETCLENDDAELVIPPPIALPTAENLLETVPSEIYQVGSVKDMDSAMPVIPAPCNNQSLQSLVEIDLHRTTSGRFNESSFNYKKEPAVPDLFVSSYMDNIPIPNIDKSCHIPFNEYNLDTYELGYGNECPLPDDSLASPCEDDYINDLIESMLGAKLNT